MKEEHSSHLDSGGQGQHFPQLPMMFAKTHIDLPRLQVFSGDSKECSYLQWRYEIGCLVSSGTYPVPVLLHAVWRSLRGKAAEILLNIEEKVTISHIFTKFYACFGEVLSMQQLLAKFYEAVQSEKEKVTCRIEDLISRARADGKLPLDVAEHMLRTKFWSGLKSAALRAAVRSKVEQGVSFDNLLIYARTMEQEMGLCVQDSVSAKQSNRMLNKKVLLISQKLNQNLMGFSSRGDP